MKPTILKDIERVSSIVFVMGDPDRVVALSNTLEDKKVLFNKRGILVVDGVYRGQNFTIASHGIGCPMASLVFEELGLLGARVFIRLGTTGSLIKDLRIGDVLLVAGAGYMANGCSTNMYSPHIHGGSSPDPLLLARIHDHLIERGMDVRVGLVFTSDAFHVEEQYIDQLVKRGFIAIDMETAILYILGWMRNWRTLSILIVSNNVLEKTKMLTTHELLDRFKTLFKHLLDFFIEHSIT